MGGFIITNQRFIERAKQAHDNFFSYEKLEYISPKRKVIITCPVHGDFQQRPLDHLGGHGCSKCRSDKARRWTETDDNFLKENYASFGAYHCQLHLNKSLHAIRGRAALLGITHKQQKWPYQMLSCDRWSAIVTRAKKKGFEINISPEYVEKIFLEQNKKCALTNLDLVMCNQAHLNTASVDRIDSEKGYIEGNIQIVHKDVNWMKNEFSDEYFYKVCSAVSKYRGKDFNHWDNGMIMDIANDREYPDFRYKSNWSDKDMLEMFD